MLNGTPPIRELGYWSQLSTDTRAELLRRGTALAGISAELRAQVGMLIDDVQARGDRALLAALERFDSCTITADELRVNSAEIGRACDNLTPSLKEAIAEGITHIRRFNEKLTAEREWSFLSEPGLRLGEKLTPIESVGLFIPGGKAVYPSVLMQLGTAAVVAGIEKIAVAIPPIPGTGGAMDSAVLFVAKELGIDEIYRVNGPAGVAALGFGTETLPHVRMVVGPGSPAVICAQLEMQRFGCATVMLMGPSESMILADSGADSRLVAADLLNEAEHGPDSASILVTDSETLLEAVQVEVTRQIDRLPEPRRAYAMASLGKNGGAILVRDMQQGVDVVNEYAPEHLQIAVRDEDRVLGQVRNAGEILVGQWTPISAANFLIGCPAILPTGGFAKVSSGVTALTFLKRTAVARCDKVSLPRMSEFIMTLARYEGFPAHEAAVQVRIDES